MQNWKSLRFFFLLRTFSSCVTQVCFLTWLLHCNFCLHGVVLLCFGFFVLVHLRSINENNSKAQLRNTKNLFWPEFWLWCCFVCLFQRKEKIREESKRHKLKFTAMKISFTEKCLHQNDLLFRKRKKYLLTEDSVQKNVETAVYSCQMTAPKKFRNNCGKEMYSKALLCICLNTKLL